MFELKSIGIKIRDLRRRKNLSQENLAEIIDVNFRTIQRIETGKNIPSLETLSKLAVALDINIQDFFETNGCKTREEIINDINYIIHKLDEKRLKDFYKAIYTFYN